MKNRNLLKIIILFLIVLFFCLLCILIYLIKETHISEELPSVIVQKQENSSKNEIEKEVSKETDKLSDIKLGNKSTIFSDNSYLNALKIGDMNVHRITSGLDEGKDIGNGYISYNNDTIQIRTTLIQTVRNIIFTKKYNEEEIVKGVTTQTSLREIKELYPNNNFGSIDQNYLGYITNDFYYFFYDDEISVYGLTYKEDKKFEELLTRYLEDRDLDKFINTIQTSLRYYDYLEYNPEIKKAHVVFSHRGYEIDIQQNNPKGIILYNNYYLTDTTKDYIKRGLISLNEDENLVEKIEKERRRNR